MQIRKLMTPVMASTNSTYRVQHPDSHRHVVRLTADDDQPLVLVDGSTGVSGSARVGDSDDALGLGSDFVDLDAGLSDDYRDAT